MHLSETLAEVYKTIPSFFEAILRRIPGRQNLERITGENDASLLGAREIQDLLC